MGKGFLLVISGPAGAGKGTICNELLERNKDMVFSISATTRNPRSGEEDGVHYHFIDKEKFEEMVKENEFLEHAYVHTDYYGTPKQFVYDEIEDNKLVLLEIDVQGAIQVKENHPQVVSIFLLPPSMEELEHRIVTRGTETPEQIEKRMSNAYKEIETINEYDYYVVNDEIEKAVEAVEEIIRAERSKVDRHPNIKEQYLNKGGI